MSRHTLYDRIEEAHGHRFIRLKSGRLMSFWDAMGAADRANTALGTAISRCFKLARDEYDLERLEWRIDNLETYIGALRKALQKQRGVQTQKERIALLRNTEGRTPIEAAAFTRKADALEAKLMSDV